MKHFTLLLLVCISFFLTGCGDNTVKATTVEGVLLSIEDLSLNLHNISSWKKLNFKDGRTVMVHYGPGDSLYIGHYQVIEINNKGMITEVKCKSFERLVKTDGYQVYDPNNVALSEEAKARAKRLLDAQLENERE